MVTQELVNSIFDYDPDTGFVSYKSTGKRAGHETSTGYRKLSIKGKLYFEHRIIWLLVHGHFPKKGSIDHINRVRHDNRLCNLRDACQVIQGNNKNKVGVSTLQLWERQKDARRAGNHKGRSKPMAYQK